MHKYRVTLIVDRSYGEKLRRLPVGGPMWIIDTPNNHELIEEIWKDPDRMDYMTGVTSFRDHAGMTPEEIVTEMFDTIYEHHGPYSHDPPMDAIRVIGARRTIEIANWFREEGFRQATGADYDFEIKKANCEQGA